ncbi:MAG: hypothetical protein JSW58_00450 [Candidatus Latescibacterota bacterium]|nr:MAG: hypothetical protein JSW58_00450 [Candidatus Latescibacterota bacterium]
MCEKNRLLLVFLLVLVFSASAVYAQMDIYLYNEEVANDIDIEAFLEDGEVVLVDGGSGEGSMKYVETGPAPPPYPQVQVWEKDIERLGPTSNQVDGLRFINHGTHWVKNRQALVLWTIEIPQALERFDTEFGEDLTLSLWVDWNRDEMWNKNEKMIHAHVNLHEFFASSEETIRVHYLTGFQIPDIDAMVLAEKQGDSLRDVVNLWVRGIVSYDDPDVSPDGEQIFGEVEDYRVKYMMTPRGKKEL